MHSKHVSRLKHSGPVHTPAVGGADVVVVGGTVVGAGVVVVGTVVVVVPVVVVVVGAAVVVVGGAVVGAVVAGVLEAVVDVPDGAVVGPAVVVVVVVVVVGGGVGGGVAGLGFVPKLVHVCAVTVGSLNASHDDVSKVKSNAETKQQIVPSIFYSIMHLCCLEAFLEIVKEEIAWQVSSRVVTIETAHTISRTERRISFEIAAKIPFDLNLNEQLPFLISCNYQCLSN